MKKWFPLVLLITVVTFGFWLLKPSPSDDRHYAHSLPWQIETINNGLSRVFGLTLAQSTLGEAMDTLGEDYEIAVVIDSDDNAGLEVYISHFMAGPLKGKLIIGAEADEKELESMRLNASDAKYMASGARQFFLNPEDLTRARQFPIQSISFIPAANLDAEIIEARFGKARHIVASGPGIRHFLYPTQGVDITLNEEARELLQYVAPKDFSLLSEPLAGSSVTDAKAQEHPDPL